MKGCCIKGVFTGERTGRRQMDFVLRRRVISSISTVGQDLYLHTFTEFGDKLVLCDIAFLEGRKFRYALNIVSIKDGGVFGREPELRGISAVGDFMLILFPGKCLFVFDIRRIPVLHVGGLGTGFQVPFLFGVVLAVIVHDLHHGYPTGVCIALQHRNQG